MPEPRSRRPGPEAITPITPRNLLGSRPELRWQSWRLTWAILQSLPYRVGLVFALAMGAAAWLVDASGRSRVRRNLRPLMPGAHQATLERAVRRCYVHFTLMLNETLRLHRLPRWLTGPKNIRVIDPWHCLQRPIPGPALLCTVHCNWELLLGIAHHQGWAPRSWVHSRSHGDHRIDHLLDRLRASVGARSLHSETAPLASLRSLRLGRLVGMVVDRDYRGDGIPVNMAGQATTIPAGPASLSVQTGAPIIPVLCARRGASAFTVLVGKPLQADSQQPKQQQVLAMSQDLATTLGRFIGAIPSQWMAFHEAWPASLSGPGKTGNRRE